MTEFRRALEIKLDSPEAHTNLIDALFQRLDIALDTSRHNAQTTSPDVLSMGVSLVSPAAITPVSRVDLSQLTNLDLPELESTNESEFVAIAEGFAHDLSRPAEPRSTLRDRTRHSVLMGAPRFARQVEQTYRKMRRSWLQRKSHSRVDK